MKPDFKNTETFVSSLQSQRWLMVLVFALMLVGLELTRSYINAQYDFNYAYRVLLFGVALPLLVGITFSVPASLERRLSLVNRTKQAKQRVLVSTQEILLGAGIESLILRQNELSLIKMLSTSTSELIAKINRLKPEVVILDEKMYEASLNDLMACMNERPEMRLVVVSDSDNRIEIYNKRQFWLTQATDLVETMCRVD